MTDLIANFKVYSKTTNSMFGYASPKARWTRIQTYHKYAKQNVHEYQKKSHDN